MGLGKPKREIIKLWERGIQHTPRHAALHLSATYALLPRWGGAPGDVSKLATRARTELPGDSGALAYAEMAEAYLRWESGSSIVDAGFDLADLESAAETPCRRLPAIGWRQELRRRRRRLPASRPRGSLGSLRVVGRGHRPTHVETPYAFRTIPQLVAGQARGDRFGILIFGPMGLSQVAFSAEPAELITIGADPWKQIGRWDAAAQKLQNMSPLPPTLALLDMSDRGKYSIAWAEFGPQRRIVVLDRTSSKAPARPDATLPRRGRLSEESRQFATFGQGNTISVYDLQSPDSEPAHRLELEDRVDWVEFPAAQETVEHHCQRP